MDNVKELSDQELKEINGGIWKDILFYLVTSYDEVIEGYNDGRK